MKTEKDRWSNNRFFNAEGERMKTLVVDPVDSGIEIHLDGKDWIKVSEEGGISWKGSMTWRRSA